MSELLNKQKTKELIRTLRQLMPELQRQYHVKSLGVFGSHIRYEQDKDSDLDLLIEFYEAPSLFEWIKLEEKLAALLNIKVDLVMKEALKPKIGGHIIAEVILI